MYVRLSLYLPSQSLILALSYVVLCLLVKLYIRQHAPLGKELYLHTLRTQLSAQHMVSINNKCWASLVAQWLGIHLPMQGTWVRALVWEYPTCRGATRPMRHNY